MMLMIDAVQSKNPAPKTRQEIKMRIIELHYQTIINVRKITYPTDITV